MLVSVVIPLYDKRVEEEECLDSWCHRQTLSGAGYEVIVTSDATNPAAENRVTNRLRPGDRLIRSPGANMAGLYHAGAIAARGTWILLTELHCIAEPDCIEKLLAYLGSHDVVGAVLRSEGGCPNVFARVECELFEEFFEKWSSPQDWRKVLVRGVAIRRDVYEAAGGLDAAYNRFADWILAARLDSQGFSLGYASEACVLHYYSTSYRQFYTPVAEHTLDEYAFRAAAPQEFCERYFGTHPDWSSRGALRPGAAREACRVLWKRMRKLGWSQSRSNPWLMRELRCCLPVALWGLRARMLKARAAIVRTRLACFRARNDQKRLRGAYLAAYQSIEDYFRLAFISEHLNKQTPVPRALTYSMSSVAGEHLAGFHGLEHWQGESFRWTRGLGLIRVNPPPARYCLRIRALPVGADPAGRAAGVFFNGIELRDARFARDHSIVAVVGPEMFIPGQSQTVALLAQPIDASLCHPDTRVLGLPLADLCFEPVDGGNQDVEHEGREAEATPGQRSTAAYGHGSASA